MFATLKRFFRSRIKRSSNSNRLDSSSRPEASLPLGLSRDQLEQIQAWTQGPSYKHYSLAMERLYENNLQAILRGLTHDAYMFQCGVCFAIEQIAALPADLTLKLRELDARHTAAPDTTDAAAVFANTPFWDAYQRLSARSRQYGGAGVPLPRQ